MMANRDHGQAGQENGGGANRQQVKAQQDKNETALMTHEFFCNKRLGLEDAVHGTSLTWGRA